ncbi:uncharacterized protein LOC127244853 isoform X2 [Andrographis paniculata]|uniref:uncharacterized protein LOC127244853 isoform X2 n=1 Tax=Andrographis paniculata TaxID=175694 RepID=UPI0021E72CB5|nr:uncharacterized protein LOC127244853 isoform X2 [Andrographis paniculata]
MDTTNMRNLTGSDADALLPPRKRLLAGLKRSQMGIRSLSDEGIVEASRTAAVEAARTAKAARANAEEKAKKAAKAVAAAKAALELVASLSMEASNKEENLKKNKMKKHVPVEALYNNKNNTKGSAADEQLARKLHQAINSSPRISNNLPSLNLKSHKHKKMKHSAISEGTSIWNGDPLFHGNLCSTTSMNGSDTIGEIYAEGRGPVKKIDTTVGDVNRSNYIKGDKLKLHNGAEQEPSRPNFLKPEKNKFDTILSNNKFAESLGTLGKRRGKIKQKKLPLSFCSFRDRSSPKEKVKPQGAPQLEDDAVSTCGVPAGLIFHGAFR